MTTITRFTKEQLIKRMEEQRSSARYALSFVQDSEILRDIEMDLRITEIALASLEADSDSSIHPAHGPLSNDRLHRIREILGKAAAQSDGGNLGYAMSDAVKAIDELLDARKAEPDYYVVVTSAGVWQSFCKTRAEAEFIVSKPFNPGYSVLEIYTTPPAPVAMKDHQIRELVNELRDVAVEYHGTQQLRERIARAVSAAMLNGGKS